MALTNNQKTALAAGLRAETEPTVVTALSIGDHVYLAEWCAQSHPSTDVWLNAATGAEMFEITDIPKFNALTGAARDSWRLMLDFSPIDFKKQANRKAVIDVWGGTDGPGVLGNCRRKGTRGEVYIGGTLETTSAVSALDLNYYGPISTLDIGQALLANP